MNLPVPVYLRPLDQKDASMKVRYYVRNLLRNNIQYIQCGLLCISMNSEENEVFILCSLFVSQLWCAAGVNLSGGRIAELTKQTKGSQSSLDQLEQENKVRVSTLRKRLFLLSSA